jgi:hypothetical protein
LIESCNTKGPATQTQQEAEPTVDTLPGDFLAFYDRFHEDSAYQMDHIIFPLEGLPGSIGEGDTLSTSRYFWQKSEWKKHNHFTDPGQNFEQWYEILNEQIIEHWIKTKGTNMHMKRRFAKLDDGWYLIYYQAPRPTVRE